MSRRRKTNHLRRPPTSLNRGVDLARLQRDRLMDTIGAFAEDMSGSTGMPMQMCAEYGLMMLTNTEYERQCAACMSLHTNYPSLAWYFDAGSQTTVLWSACEDCVGTPDITEVAKDNLLAWVDGSVEPEGLVVIFAPPAPKEDSDGETTN